MIVSSKRLEYTIAGQPSEFCCPSAQMTEDQTTNMEDLSGNFKLQEEESTYVIMVPHAGLSYVVHIEIVMVLSNSAIIAERCVNYALKPGATRLIDMFNSCHNH
ncbi:hypothetical protein M9H77_22831 [Catharanthus roseus]|uniref:Uncharacterized protein n=1 Tax=Catharanthus roseus TaxID=4058 RepID=A0ACC0ARA3_CATRO|nr:hypothetical protein M9H77_22831 [Catharanthus roseus]